MSPSIVDHEKTRSATPEFLVVNLSSPAKAFCSPLKFEVDPPSLNLELAVGFASLLAHGVWVNMLKEPVSELVAG